MICIISIYVAHSHATAIFYLRYVRGGGERARSFDIGGAGDADADTERESGAESGNGRSAF